ncbi:dephospho-CoA kinase [Anoxybacillus kestanbolensis]|uniref:dephospho-CoA kinase n=1 Tax=Anoxybacillus TaxID=150247 RepID=UPI001EDC3CCE|nr:dephospho-CoA kinase [Anoxybacillus sp. LAT_26]MCG3086147.1 dephospho-CoA kinase [Anoxybacillus sp. LAT27]MCG5024157.1 dephospho-CoA kinase [Anoxybacillus flavithermus]MCG6173870.1 dephospho-CoA kinase [Anoxybacillus sp. LAT_31]MCG6180347.1 dephospho-CoA kinase [Anoxybacillus sp. LAT_33]MCG6198838.1 dephospho-CoA kinase [Anoxybacillus sp. LAT_38]MCL9969910.1 dephospho-CoA kinase [Anoxybacillus kestanbolensis]
MVLTIGLTGGIASGKSTVAAMFRDLHIPVIDADEIAHRVTAIDGEAYQLIVETFGSEILDSNGAIDRRKLGAIVFHDEQKRKQLNAIVHPLVRKHMLQQKEQYARKGEKAVVLDIPLLFESNLEHLVDRILVVYVDEQIQLRRLCERNGFSFEEAWARIKSQMPLEQKRKKADAVIDNNGTIEQTKRQLYERLVEWGILEK